MTKWYDLDQLEANKKKYFSQNGEDGLLDYIFFNIGEASRYCVEFGAGKVSNIPNTKRLRDRGWDGVMFERKEKLNPPEIREQYKVKTEIITDLNINDIFKKHDVPQNVDLVSIDIDGQDYYVWKSLEWRPRVVLIEFNEGLGPDESKVMKLDRDHWQHRDKTYYYGASISAFKKIGKEMGYTLLCKVGRNLVFILDELLPEKIDRDVHDIHPIAMPESYKTPDPYNREWDFV